MDLITVVSIVISLLLWLLVGTLALTAAIRSKALFREGAYEGGRDFVVLIPRVLIGVIGSGYIAAVMPQDVITTWIGPGSGVLGIVIAALCGGGRRAEGRRRRPASDRLYDGLVALYDPAAVQLGNPHDGTAGGVAARRGVDSAADPGRDRRHADRQAVSCVANNEVCHA